MEAIFWQSSKDRGRPLQGSIISFLMKEQGEIKKFTLIPFKDNYLVVRATSKEKWSTQGYWEEKADAGTKKLKIDFTGGVLLDLGEFKVSVQKGLPKKGRVLGIIEE